MAAVRVFRSASGKLITEQFNRLPLEPGAIHIGTWPGGMEPVEITSYSGQVDTAHYRYTIAEDDSPHDNREFFRNGDLLQYGGETYRPCTDPDVLRAIRFPVDKPAKAPNRAYMRLHRVKYRVDGAYVLIFQDEMSKIYWIYVGKEGRPMYREPARYVSVNQNDGPLPALVFLTMKDYIETPGGTSLGEAVLYPLDVRHYSIVVNNEGHATLEWK